MERAGFSLVELMITSAILFIVGALALVAVRSSATSQAVANTASDVHRNVRDLTAAMSRELEVAARETDAAKGIQAPVVRANPVAGSPIQVAFQRPLDTTGTNWSRQIIFRYINEDANANGVLDPGEDTDRDGVLSRRVLRLQDLNSDGDMNDAGEQTVVAGVNDISNLGLTFDGDEITLTVQASKPVNNQIRNTIEASATSRVYLLN